MSGAGQDVGCMRWSHFSTPGRWTMPQAVNLSNPAVTPAGAKTFNLVLASGALAQATTYTFQLDVTTTHPAGRGQAQVVVAINTVRQNPCEKKAEYAQQPTLTLSVSRWRPLNRHSASEWWGCHRLADLWAVWRHHLCRERKRLCVRRRPWPRYWFPAACLTGGVVGTNSFDI